METGETEAPRRVQVNAFGFGGSNYVLQMEQCATGGKTVVRREISSPTPEMTADLSPFERDFLFFVLPWGRVTAAWLFLPTMGMRPRLKLKDFPWGFSVAPFR